MHAISVKDSSRWKVGYSRKVPCCLKTGVRRRYYIVWWRRRSSSAITHALAPPVAAAGRSPGNGRCQHHCVSSRRATKTRRHCLVTSWPTDQLTYLHDLLTRPIQVSLNPFCPEFQNEDNDKEISSARVPESQKLKMVG